MNTTEQNPPVIDPAKSTPGITTISASDLTAPLAGAMPDPTEHAGESMTSEPVEYRDSRKTLFDPEKHATKPDGTPAKNKHGNFYSKGVGKHGPSKPAQPSAPTRPAPVNRPPPTFAGQPAPDGSGQPADFTDLTGEASRIPLGPDAFELQAEAYLLTSYAPLMALFTAEVRPSDEEHVMLKQALANWFRKMKRVPEINEGLTFGMCAMGVFAHKLGKPSVREKWEMYKLRALQLWQRWTGKGDKK